MKRSSAKSNKNTIDYIGDQALESPSLQGGSSVILSHKVYHKFPDFDCLYNELKKKLPDRHNDVIRAAARLFANRSMDELSIFFALEFWCNKNNLLFNPLGSKTPDVFISHETKDKIKNIFSKYFQVDDEKKVC